MGEMIWDCRRPRPYLRTLGDPTRPQDHKGTNSGTGDVGGTDSGSASGRAHEGAVRELRSEIAHAGRMGCSAAEDAKSSEEGQHWR